MDFSEEQPATCEGGGRTMRAFCCRGEVEVFFSCTGANMGLSVIAGEMSDGRPVFRVE